MAAMLAECFGFPPGPGWIMEGEWIAARLHEIRQHAGLSQTRLAEMSGVTQGAIGHWENGKRIPGAPELYRLADALGVSCDEFRQPVGTPIRWKRKPPRPADAPPPSDDR